MTIPHRQFLGAAAFMLVGSSGCGLMPSSGLVPQLIVENRTDSDATLRLVEYDFVAGEEGDVIGDPMTPLGAGGTATGDMPMPDVESWALLVNDIVAVTSFGLAESVASLPGQGPIVVHVAVEEGALMTSTSRVGDPAGETSAPTIDR